MYEVNTAVQILWWWLKVMIWALPANMNAAYVHIRYLHRSPHTFSALASPCCSPPSLQSVNSWLIWHSVQVLSSAAWLSSAQRAASLPCVSRRFNWTPCFTLPDLMTPWQGGQLLLCYAARNARLVSKKLVVWQPSAVTAPSLAGCWN